MIRRILAGSRFGIAFAVIGCFFSAMTLLVYGFFTVGEIIWDLVKNPDVSSSGAKDYSVEFIELTDTFLLGTVLYIVAAGLYDLFIDRTLPLPEWLHFEDLDDLKERLIGVIVVLLAVTFLGDVVGNEAVGVDILYLGGAIATVILALALLRWVDGAKKVGGGRDGGTAGSVGTTTPTASRAAADDREATR